MEVSKSRVDSPSYERVSVYEYAPSKLKVDLYTTIGPGNIFYCAEGDGTHCGTAKKKTSSVDKLRYERLLIVKSCVIR